MIDPKLQMARRVADKIIPEDADYENEGARMTDWFLARDAALAAIEECTARDDRLTFTERGDLVLHLAWALKPGQPQIIAVCTYAELAKKYADAAGQIVPGATGYVEETVADHAFGRDDIQSALYKHANRIAR